MRNFFSKFLVFCIGIISALLFLEISLHIAGIIFNQPRKADHQNRKTDDVFTILCLGNSYTYGMGATASESYPAYLERMLNSRQNKKRIKVLNYGKLNLNSEELLQELELNIQQTQPDLIILRTGSPNFWNSYYYDRYAQRKQKNAEFSSGDNFFRKSINKVKLLKLIRFVKTRHASQYQTIQARDPDFPIYSGPDNEEVMLGFKIFFSSLVDNSFVVDPDTLQSRKEWLTARISDSDENAYWFYFVLGNIYVYEKKYAQAIQMFIRGINSNQDLSSNNINYLALKMYLLKNEMRPYAPIIMKNLKEFDDINKEKSSSGFLMLSHHDVLPWIASNVQDSIRIIKSRGIKLIIHNYPLVWEKSFYRDVNSVLKKQANEAGIPFIDNETYFNALWEQNNKNDYRERILGVTGVHLNAKGYEVQAEYICDFILKHDFLGN